MLVLRFSLTIEVLTLYVDVYNMQLSNPAAEQLANYLVTTGNGAFDLCGFVSGGSEAMEAAIKLARQV